MFGVGSLASYENFEQVGEGTYGYVFKATCVATSSPSSSSSSSSLFGHSSHAAAALSSSSSSTSVGDKRGLYSSSTSTVEAPTAFVALKKMIFPHRETAGFPVCMVREIKMLKSLNHMNIVKLLDIVSSKGCEYIDANIKQQSLKSSQQQQVKEGVGVVKKDNEQDNKQENRPAETDQERKTAEKLSNQMKRFGNLFMVFEYIDHDLGGLIDSQLIKFSQKQIKCISKQLFDVLQYLDDRKIVHRDIKSSNILIGNNFVIKLADFGLSRLQHMDDEGRPLDMTNNVVTMWYKSPELLLGSKRYTSAVDMWSASCVIAELELRRPVFPGKTEVDQVELIFKGIGTPSESSWPDIKDMPLYHHIGKEKSIMPKQNHPASFRANYQAKFNGSETLLDLLCGIFIADPLKRINSKAALSHSFFRDARNPLELDPLKIESGASYHEFQTKQKRRQKQEEEQNKLLKEEQDALVVSKLGSSISLPDTELESAYHAPDKKAHININSNSNSNSISNSNSNNGPKMLIIAPPILPNSVSTGYAGGAIMSAGSSSYNFSNNNFPNNHLGGSKLIPPPPLLPSHHMQKPVILQPTDPTQVIDFVEMSIYELKNVIGVQGSTIRDIQNKTGTKCITIGDNQSLPTRRMEVRGARDDVRKAIAMIHEKMREKERQTIGICYDFLNQGECKRGSTCSFSHITNNTSRDSSSNNSNSNTGSGNQSQFKRPKY